MAETAKILQSALNKIKLATAKVVRDVQYENSSAGWSRPGYQIERGARHHQKLVRKLNRAAISAHALARELNNFDLVETLGRIRTETENVIACCDHFPRDAAWQGDKALALQHAQIDKARCLIRGEAP